jgi:hypothetical protein
VTDHAKARLWLDGMRIHIDTARGTATCERCREVRHSRVLAELLRFGAEHREACGVKPRRARQEVLPFGGQRNGGPGTGSVSVADAVEAVRTAGRLLAS